MRARTGFLFLIAVSSAVIVVSAVRESPLVKASALIDSLKLKATKDGETETAQYTKYSHWCQDTKKIKNRDIARLTDAVAGYTSQVNAATADIQALDRDLEDLSTAINKNTVDLNDAMANRNAEASAYAAANTDYNNTLIALDSAIERIQGVRSNVAAKSFLQRSMQSPEEEGDQNSEDEPSPESFSLAQKKKQTPEEEGEHTSEDEPSPESFSLAQKKQTPDEEGEDTSETEPSPETFTLIQKKKQTPEEEGEHTSEDEPSPESFSLAQKKKQTPDEEGGQSPDSEPSPEMFTLAQKARKMKAKKQDPVEGGEQNPESEVSPETFTLLQGLKKQTPDEGEQNPSDDISPESFSFAQMKTNTNAKAAKSLRRRVLTTKAAGKEVPSVATGKEAADYINRLPKRKLYDFKSNSVLELFGKMRAKFLDDMRVAEAEESNRDFAFKSLKQDLEHVISDAQASLASKTAEKAARGEDKAQAEASLLESQKSLDLDKSYLGEVTTECSTKASEYEERTAVRAKEMQLFEQAKTVLSKVLGNETPEEIEARLKSAYSESPAAALLQVAAVVRRSPDASSKMRKALEKAVSLVKGMHSKDLDALAVTLEAAAMEAGQPTGVCRFCDKSPFDTLKQMIEKLVFKLMQAQTDEDNHKAWCDEEIRKTTQSKTTKDNKATQMDAQISQLAAEVNSLSTDITTLAKDTAELSKQMEEQTVTRDANKRANENSIQDAEEAQTALARVIKVLADFYAKTGALPKPSLLSYRQEPEGVLTVSDAPETWTGSYKSVESGTDAVSLFKSIQQSYAVMEADTKAAEATDAKQFSEYMAKARSTKASYEESSKLKTRRKQSLEGEVQAKQADRKHLQREQDATEKYLKDLDHPCGESASTFADRKAARQSEIDGLNQASVILKNAFNEVQAAQTTASA